MRSMILGDLLEIHLRYSREQGIYTYTLGISIKVVH